MSEKEKSPAENPPAEETRPIQPQPEPEPEEDSEEYGEWTPPTPKELQDFNDRLGEDSSEESSEES